MIPAEQRDEWRALAEAATPGPWRAVEGDLEGKPASEYLRTLLANREADGTTSGRLFLTLAPNDIDPEAGAEVVPATTGDGPRSEANGAFIAAARTAVPALLDALEAAERERDAARKHAERERTAQKHWHDKWVAVLGTCICDGNPATTDGPEEDCPQHGRSYTEWIQRGDALQAENQRLRDGITALADDYASEIDWSSGRSNYGDNAAYERAARDLRALLNPDERTEAGAVDTCGHCGKTIHEQGDGPWMDVLGPGGTVCTQNVGPGPSIHQPAEGATP